MMAVETPQSKVSKICSKCNEEKLLSEYPRDKSMKDGYRADCKMCERSRKKISYRAKKNPMSSVKQAIINEFNMVKTQFLACDVNDPEWNNLYKRLGELRKRVIAKNFFTIPATTQMKETIISRIQGFINTPKFNPKKTLLAEEIDVTMDAGNWFIKLPEEIELSPEQVSDLSNLIA
jgi:hypothetical protein